jgi:hypothetical protein
MPIYLIIGLSGFHSYTYFEKILKAGGTGAVARHRHIHPLVSVIDPKIWYTFTSCFEK